MKPNVNNLMKWLSVTEEQAHELMSHIRTADSWPTDYERHVNKALDLANRFMQAYGVEAVRGKWVDNYYGDAVALYVNTGNSYTGTLLYDTVRGKFEVTSWGDFVEKYERRYKIS